MVSSLFMKIYSLSHFAFSSLEAAFSVWLQISYEPSDTVHRFMRSADLSTAAGRSFNG